ncbi:MAG: hypothetical protein ACOVO3_00695 [Fluviicola sp.]
MKQVIAGLILTVVQAGSLFAQENAFAPNGKGNFYVFWGWNRANYTKSTIHFTGDDYDFTLNKVVAKDRQSQFSSRIYLNPANLTIPQTNLRFGYYFKDKWQLSMAVDHMKYVMVNDQTVKMMGRIANSGTAYDGVYTEQDFQIKQDFLLYEHTDGLNYLNVELRRSDVLWGWKHIWISGQYGAGLGALMPKTNATLLNNARHDAFHLAGYGLAAVGAVNINFYKYFFIQGELKGGFIHMPDVRTTQYKADRASQKFVFAEYVISLGVNVPFGQFKKD